MQKRQIKKHFAERANNVFVPNEPMPYSLALIKLIQAIVLGEPRLFI